MLVGGAVLVSPTQHVADAESDRTFTTGAAINSDPRLGIYINKGKG